MNAFDKPCEGNDRGFHSIYFTVNGYDQEIKSCHTCWRSEGV